MKEFLTIITLTLMGTAKCLIDRIPNPDNGVSAGFLPYCPGVEKNSTFTRETLNRLKVRIYSLSEHGFEIQTDHPIESFFTDILRDKSFDLKKKTVFYAEAYYDSTFDPLNKKIASLYSNMGYNVLISETLTVLSRHYPKSVRLSRAVGLKIGELLVKLVDNGLDIANLELVGMSIGAHIISFAAKHLFAVTGKKPYKLTGLDPAGPCFRNQVPDEIFSSQDAERVSVIHTNIDMFGMARAFGQVDFYVNGGEYQPGPAVDPACLALCSHIKAVEYYIQMLKYPQSFIGVKCDSVQDARYARCYGNKETNLAGPLTDFSKPGIYYLPTKLEYPYYAGEEGLKPENEPFLKYMLDVNAEDVYVA
ncbi:phospholipase A1 VesT1.02-like [Pieris rapae]|uniref:phospholipase A1 VesT1.02-like n=1 Tax=Pieris rapae TaxID=64459 RepID=UPI001E27B5F0|nr:phospholipase A1 VesT1.02-like [Pieris rapae]